MSLISTHRYQPIKREMKRSKSHEIFRDLSVTPEPPATPMLQTMDKVLEEVARINSAFEFRYRLSPKIPSNEPSDEEECFDVIFFNGIVDSVLEPQEPDADLFTTVVDAGIIQNNPFSIKRVMSPQIALLKQQESDLKDFQFMD